MSETPAASPHRRWAAPLLVLVVSVAVYANTLFAGFTWDDDWLILDNPRIADPTYIHYMLFERTKLWRPVKRISLMADWQLWTRIPAAVTGRAWKRPWAGGFHATNLALEAGACLALWALVLRLSGNRRIATVSALLFAVHPIHVESIANISHRKEPLSLLFYLLAFLAYLRSRDAAPAPGPVTRLLAGIRLVRGRHAVVATRLEFLMWTALAFLLGMLSLEVGAVMFPATVVVYELALAPGTARERVRRVGLLLAPLVPVLLLFFFRGYIGTLNTRFSAAQVLWITEGRTSSYLVVLLAAVKVFGIYAALLVWPWPLYLDRAFTLPAAFPMGLLEPAVLAGMGALAAYGWSLWWSWRRSRLAFFGLVWYGLNLLPVLNVIPLTHWLLAERFVYVPSAGLALLAALGFEALWKGEARLLAPETEKQAAPVLLTALLAVHGMMTLRQNEVWHDSVSLWSQTLKYNKSSYRGLYGYGLEIDHQGKAAEAEDMYRKAIAASPAYAEPHYALALLMLNQKRYDQAIAEAEAEAKLDNGDPEPYIVIGNAHFNQGQYEPAIAAYRKAVERKATHTDALFNLANALSADRKDADALPVLEKILEVRADAEVLVFHGNVLERLGRQAEALQSYERALQTSPEDTSALNAAGVLLVRMGRGSDAIDHLEHSLAIDPTQAKMQQILERLRDSLGETSARHPAAAGR